MTPDLPSLPLHFYTHESPWREIVAWHTARPGDESNAAAFAVDEALRSMLYAYASRAIEAYELGARSTAAQPAGFKLLKDTTYEERSWPEDRSHENGNYSCCCVNCLRQFTGHKRRVVCKVCDAAPAASGDSTPPSEPADGEQLWLWQNGDHFLAFRHLYPCYSPGGDPMTLGEPFGRAIFKHSHNREGKPNEQQRTDRQGPGSGSDLDLQRRHAASAGQACAAGAGASLGYGEHQAAQQVGWGACGDGAREQQSSDIAGAAGVLAAGRNFAQGVAAQGDSIGAPRPEPEAAGQGMPGLLKAMRWAYRSYYVDGYSNSDERDAYISALEDDLPVLFGQVDDLVALVGRLVRSLRKAAPGDALADGAMDYLRRKGLNPSPLRAAEPPPAASQQADREAE